MSTRKVRTIAILLPPRMVDELDRVRKREHRTRSELMHEALGRYVKLADRSHTIRAEDALPEEIDAMRGADEEYSRGECVRLEDLRHKLRL